mgnify:CR=1 FL=1
MSETNEYDNVEEETTNATPMSLPQGVMERMEKHAERTGDKLTEVITHYLSLFLYKNSCSAP